jgi:hypothetical protein
MLLGKTRGIPTLALHQCVEWFIEHIDDSRAEVLNE